MREYVFSIMGIASMLVGISTIIATILTLTINKESRLYKYLTKPKREDGRLDKYLEEHLSEKANKIILIIIGVVFGIVMIVLGLNTLLKGLIDPYGPEFWFPF